MHLSYQNASKGSPERTSNQLPSMHLSYPECSQRIYTTRSKCISKWNLKIRLTSQDQSCQEAYDRKVIQSRTKIRFKVFSPTSICLERPVKVAKKYENDCFRYLKIERCKRAWQATTMFLAFECSNAHKARWYHLQSAPKINYLLRIWSTHNASKRSPERTSIHLPSMHLSYP